jgi:hypothetical protein
MRSHRDPLKDIGEAQKGLNIREGYLIKLQRSLKRNQRVRVDQSDLDLTM